jgi:ERCC4-related helicase
MHIRNARYTKNKLIFIEKNLIALPMFKNIKNIKKRLKSTLRIIINLDKSLKFYKKLKKFKKKDWLRMEHKHI